MLYTERKIYLNIYEFRKFVLVLQSKRIFLCNKEKRISTNIYFFTLKTHFLKVKILFFDLNIIFLIVNTFSFIGCKTNTNFLSLHKLKSACLNALQFLCKLYSYLIVQLEELRKLNLIGTVVRELHKILL